MSLVEHDIFVAELAFLDILDVRPDGSLALNAGFHAELVLAFDTSPHKLSTVVQECILARALARGYAGCADLDELALAALEVGAAEETAR